MESIRYGLLHDVLIVLASGPAAWLLFRHLQMDPNQAAWATVMAVTVLLIGDLLATPRRVQHDFASGRFHGAIQGTHTLLLMTIRPKRRAALRLNLASASLAAGDLDLGGAQLKRVDRSRLCERLQWVWDMNYAYYLLAGDGSSAEALAICDEAPSARTAGWGPAFIGTRGLALLALNRLDAAIAELNRIIESGHLGPGGLAEVHYHLAEAWRRKGQDAFARDHLIRAYDATPWSPYHSRARAELEAVANGIT